MKMKMVREKKEIGISFGTISFIIFHASYQIFKEQKSPLGRKLSQID